MATAAAPLGTAIPSHRPSSHNAAPPAQSSPGLDDLFNYDADSDTPAHRPTTTQPSTRAPAAAANDSTGLGIDEEIKVRKARKPIPKLDEDRLLSDAGIPKLRRISKERLRFRGKGHEFTDVARLLSTYQLWLDDLYPRAKFADGLAMVEKLGHKRRLQVMRKAWIDEEKPKNESYGLDDEDIDFVVRDPGADTLEDEAGGEFVPQPERQEGQVDHVPEDSDHDELYRRPTPNPPVRDEDGGEPSEDELDTLLAEDAAREAQQIQRAAPIQIDERDDFADEEEAMADMW